jgi:hypothetical protein
VGFPIQALQMRNPSSGAADPRRYTRIRITDCQITGAGTYSLSQLACYETVGGSDVLAGSGATITATSTFSTNTTANLVDGNDATYWASNAGGTQDLIIDWGAGNGKEIKEIGMKPRTDGLYTQFPFSGSVDYSSDNVTYTNDWNWPFLPVHFNSGGSANLLRVRRPALFPSTSPNRRIWGIKVNTTSASPPEFGQFEIRSTVGGSQIAVLGSGTPLSYTPFGNGFYPLKGFDGTGNQFPFSSTTRGYLLFDFGEGNEKAKPAQLAIKASGIPSRAPSDFDLVYIDGLGATPTVQQNFTTPATWTSSEVRTFTVT